MPQSEHAAVPRFRDEADKVIRSRTSHGTWLGPTALHSMEPIDRRITAARLMVLRTEPNAREAIAALLGVPSMTPALAMRAARDIAAFVESGDATVAAQLIHSAGVTRSQGEA